MVWLNWMPTDGSISRCRAGRLWRPAAAMCIRGCSRNAVPVYSGTPGFPTGDVPCASVQSYSSVGLRRGGSVREVAPREKIRTVSSTKRSMNVSTPATWYATRVI